MWEDMGLYWAWRNKHVMWSEEWLAVEAKRCPPPNIKVLEPFINNYGTTEYKLKGTQ